MKALDGLWHDVLFGARLFRQSPIFTAAAVVTLALGVGVNTAVFSVVNAFILRPLPVRDSDRLVVIANQNTSNRTLRGISFPNLQEYRSATADVFEDIAGYSVGFLGLAAEGGRPERVLVTWVTGNYFPLLDISPALGRVIRADEGGPGRVDAVVVRGHSTWQRRFGGDQSVVGQIVTVNGQPCRIIGVGPPDFVGTFAFSESELYLPLNWSGAGDFDNRQMHGLHAIARLRPEVTIDMGIQIVRGRSFSDADNERSRPVAIMNQHLADLLWPGRDPIGRRFRSAGPNGPWVEVVGVTKTGKYGFLFEDPQPYFYVPIAQEYTGLRVLQVRTTLRPEALGPAIEQAIRTREPNLPLYDVQSMTRALGGGLGLFAVRVGAVSAATFGLLGLTLAIIGIYSLVSYTTSQRTHEIAVHMALGVARHDVLRLVLQDGVNLLALGLGAGLLIARVPDSLEASCLAFPLTTH